MNVGHEMLTRLVLNTLNNAWVLLTNHFEEFWVLALEHVWVLCERNKVGADTSSDTAGTDTECNVEAQTKSDKQDDRVVARVVLQVLWVGLLLVDEGEERGQKTNDEGTAVEDNVDETVVDESIDTPVHKQRPGLLGGTDVAVAVESNVDVGISVEVVDECANAGNTAGGNASENGANKVTVGSSLVLQKIEEGAEQVKEGDDERAQADGAQAVSHGTAESTPSSVRDLVYVVVGCAKDAGNRGEGDVLDDLGNPVVGKDDEDHKTDDRGVAGTAACCLS